VRREAAGQTHRKSFFARATTRADTTINRAQHCLLFKQPCAALERAVHDLTLLLACDESESGGGGGGDAVLPPLPLLAERSGDDDKSARLPRAALDATAQRLEGLGAPLALAARLAAHNPIGGGGGGGGGASNRELLLLLVWLVARARLFQRALQRLQPAVDAALPPLLLAEVCVCLCAFPLCVSVLRSRPGTLMNTPSFKTQRHAGHVGVRQHARLLRRRAARGAAARGARARVPVAGRH
jgi:hypothetical protein